MREGRAADAEAVVKDALARKVDEHRFLLKLGEAQIEARQFAEAERSLRAALEKKPGLESARFNLGLALEEQGRRDEAIAAYRDEVRDHAKAYRAAFNLARLLQGTGRADEALALLPEGGRRVAHVRDGPALPGEGPARPRRPGGRRALGEGRPRERAGSARWLRSGTSCWRTSTTGGPHGGRASASSGSGEKRAAGG